MTDNNYLDFSSDFGDWQEDTPVDISFDNFSDSEEDEEEEYEQKQEFGYNGLSQITPEQLENACQAQKKGFNDLFKESSSSAPLVRDEDVTVEPDPKKIEATQIVADSCNEAIAVVKDTLTIEGNEYDVERLKENAIKETELTSPDKDKARTYNKVAEMPKSSFAKPYEQGNFMKKVIMFLMACAGVGIFMGVKANSYYVYMNGKNTSGFSCAFNGLISEGMPTVMSPFNGSIFGGGFILGFGILGVVGLFIWLDSDAKKQSRVGHEHGNAHLATPRDFKTYKNRFME